MEDKIKLTQILGYVIGIKEDVSAINQHLETLNSKVATNVLDIERNRANITKTDLTIAKWAGVVSCLFFILNLVFYYFLR